MFMIGDRVVLIVDAPDANYELYAGHEGTVLDIHQLRGETRLGVGWDDFHNGHTLNGKCVHAEGWYVWEPEVCHADDDIQLDASTLDDIV